MGRDSSMEGGSAAAHPVHVPAHGGNMPSFLWLMRILGGVEPCQLQSSSLVG